jgi:hypothetical protein
VSHLPSSTANPFEMIINGISFIRYWVVLYEFLSIFSVDPPLRVKVSLVRRLTTEGEHHGML